MQKVVERLLNLLAFLITANRPVPAAEIRSTVAGYGQAEHEAFRRMFERDKDLLRRLGIPLERRPTDAWEVEHGYVVPPQEYELVDPGLTDEERAALWLAAQAVRLGGQPSGPGAIFKLGGVPLAGAGEPLSADLGPQAEELSRAFTAIAERRRLGFSYRGVERQIHPYGLVHRRGHWYLAGAEPGHDGVRAFRVDRAGKLTVGKTPGEFARPKGFKASDAIPEFPWDAGREDVEVRIRFDPEVSWWARRQLGNVQAVEERPDGGLDVILQVANPSALIGWLIAFEDRAELLSPQWLREHLVARVEGAA